MRKHRSTTAYIRNHIPDSDHRTLGSLLPLRLNDDLGMALCIEP